MVMIFTMFFVRTFQNQDCGSGRVDGVYNVLMIIFHFP